MRFREKNVVLAAIYWRRFPVTQKRFNRFNPQTHYSCRGTRPATPSGDPSHGFTPPRPNSEGLLKVTPAELNTAVVFAQCPPFHWRIYDRGIPFFGEKFF